jgi:hypothetical protein
MTLENPHRILRRIAGRMRVEAMKIDDRPIATKLLMIATELEEMAAERRANSPRRN